MLGPSELKVTVQTAANSAEAQLAAARHTGLIHLLLTDVVMPRIDGRVLAERLAPQNPAMKVLYMSGYPDSFIAGHWVFGTGVHLLYKPFEKEGILMRTIRELLDADK